MYLWTWQQAHPADEFSIFPACVYYQEFIILVVQFISQYLQWVDLTNLVLIPSKHRLILLLLERNSHPLHDHHIRYTVYPHTVLHCWLSLIHWGLHEPLTVIYCILKVRTFLKSIELPSPRRATLCRVALEGVNCW